MADESAIEAANEDVQLSAVEREAFRETLKEQYVHLIEMDNLVREKLFILQVKEKNFKPCLKGAEICK